MMTPTLWMRELDTRAHSGRQSQAIGGWKRRPRTCRLLARWRAVPTPDNDGQREKTRGRGGMLASAARPREGIADFLSILELPREYPRCTQKILLVGPAPRQTPDPEVVDLTPQGWLAQAGRVQWDDRVISKERPETSPTNWCRDICVHLHHV